MRACVSWHDPGRHTQECLDQCTSLPACVLSSSPAVRINNRQHLREIEKCVDKKRHASLPCDGVKTETALRRFMISCRSNTRTAPTAQCS